MDDAIEPPYLLKEVRRCSVPRARVSVLDADAEFLTNRSDGAMTLKEVRGAIAKDAEAVVAAAFSDPAYALLEWMYAPVKSDKVRAAAVAEFARFVANRAVSEAISTNGMVLTARDEQGRMVGAAVVSRRPKPPPAPPHSAWALVRWARRVYERVWRPLYATFVEYGLPPPLRGVFTFGWAPLRRFLAMRSIGEHRQAVLATLPHNYLHLRMLAALPSVRKYGVGSALLRAVLAVADEIQWPVFLETDEVKLRDWYAKHGFAVRDEYAIRAPDQPQPSAAFFPNFCMVREPIPKPSESESKSEEEQEGGDQNGCRQQ